MCLHDFVKVPVGQRFHSGGNLQHTVEIHHWPESPVKVSTCVNRIGMSQELQLVRLQTGSIDTKHCFKKEKSATTPLFTDRCHSG